LLPQTLSPQGDKTLHRTIYVFDFEPPSFRPTAVFNFVFRPTVLILLQNQSAISSAESAQFKSLPLEGKVSAKQTDEVYEKRRLFEPPLIF